jgi:hypothetical protein
MDERELHAEEPRRGTPSTSCAPPPPARERRARSSVSSATWCMPGLASARKRPTGVSSPVGVRARRGSSDEHRRGLDSLSRSGAVLEARAEEDSRMSRSPRRGPSPRRRGDGCRAPARCYPAEASSPGAEGPGPSRWSPTSATPERRPRAAPAARAIEGLLLEQAWATRSRAARCFSRRRLASP